MKRGWCCHVLTHLVGEETVNLFTLKNRQRTTNIIDLACSLKTIIFSTIIGSVCPELIDRLLTQFRFSTTMNFSKMEQFNLSTNNYHKIMGLYAEK